MSLIIRRAFAADASKLAKLNVQVWQETYGPMLSSEWSESLSEDERFTKWHRALSIPNGTDYFIAEVDGEAVGFSASARGWIRPVELHSLYVLASHHGTGVGKALLDVAIEKSPAELWVVANNAKAQAFYRKNGFTPEGRTGVIEFWENLPQILMVR